VTLEASTSKRLHKRLRAVSAITTTALAVHRWLQNLFLMAGRVEQHGVGDDDGGDRKTAQDGDDLVAVRPPYRPYSCCTMAVRNG